jgi:hypothetical protein
MNWLCLEKWNVDNVIDIGFMFLGAFREMERQHNVGNVTDINGMLNGASRLNQGLEIWNGNIFNYCSHGPLIPKSGYLGYRAAGLLGERIALLHLHCHLTYELSLYLSQPE